MTTGATDRSTERAPAALPGQPWNQRRAGGAGARSHGPGAADLPRWPLLAMLAGAPAWWVLGLSPFIPAIVAFVMLVLLLRVPRVRLVPGVLALVLFALWCPASLVMLDSPLRAIGFGVRWSGIVAAMLVLIYLTNSDPRRLRDLHVLSALAVLWAFVVIGGYLGLFWPEGRLTTPMAQILPSAVLNNEFVRDLVMPKFAEVQRPWGAAEPFNRPAAPFPYTNGWGCAVALLTPVVLSLRERVAAPWRRHLLTAGLLASAVPAAATANRGMLLVLGVSIAWYIAVQLRRGQQRAAGRALGLSLAATAVAAAGGVFSLIAERQAVSDTTTGRASVYLATLEQVQRSPILGFGAPRPSQEIGIALGTQGAIWMYLFSYGVIGALLFLAFLVGVLVLTRGTPGLPDQDAWLRAVLAGALVACWFYGFDGTHLSIIVIVAGLLLRSRAQATPATQATQATQAALPLQRVHAGRAGGYRWS